MRLSRGLLSLGSVCKKGGEEFRQMRWVTSVRQLPDKIANRIFDLDFGSH